MAQDAKEFRHRSQDFDGVKKTFHVCNSDLMKVQVQVVKNGGENNLHTHTGEDAFWYVISGAVKFYGEGDKLVGEYKKGEGILVPRGYKYWFESASAEPLEILRGTARNKGIDNNRVALPPQKPWMTQKTPSAPRQ